MSYNGRYNTNSVIENPSAFTPSSIGVYEKSCKVELFKDNLPRVHFSWQEEVFLFTQDENEAKKIESLGFSLRCEEDALQGHKTWTGYALAKHTNHFWFCNFRRYGWSWTPSPDGEYGYGHGPVYANGRSFYSSTPEQVVRDSFIEAWTLLNEKMPNCFSTAPVFSVLEWMLQDALKNISGHASGRQVNEAWVKEQVQVSGL